MLGESIAICLNAVMHYYFGVSLLLAIPQSESIDTVSSIIFFVAACIYKFKLTTMCSGEVNPTYKELFLETLMHYSLLEFARIVWLGIDFLFVAMLETYLSNVLDQELINEMKMLLTTAIAIAALLSALQDRKVLHHMAKYYIDFRNRPRKAECPMSCCNQNAVCAPVRTTEQRYRDPNCPCHGDRVKR
jgi:hypothetical protein